MKIDYVYGVKKKPVKSMDDAETARRHGRDKK